jgi:transposase-like protein
VDAVAQLKSTKEDTSMFEVSTDILAGPGSEASKDVLTEVLREGARKMLMVALEQEVGEYIAAHTGERDANGYRLVVRNGHLPERSIQTGLGSVTVRQPRVDDKRRDADGERIRFTSKILPPYLRRTKQIEELIPWLYLKGISTGDYPEALAALLGPEAKGLSANTVVRLKEVWGKEYEAWRQRSLVGKRYVYMWADGIYFNVRLGDDPKKTCLLVLMGATAEGKKELVAVHDGLRESEISWREVLQDLKRRGLKNGPSVAIGDGALGFWKALRKVYGTCRIQRCWVHKTANVLDKLPKRLQSSAKEMLHQIWMAATKEDAEKAFDAFVETYKDKYPNAVDCLKQDRKELLTFYDFPAAHWRHLRTTNPIESAFATIRLRTYKTKGMGSSRTTLTMVFRLARSAEKHWRRLNGSKLIEKVIRGVKFQDGVETKSKRA